MKYAPTKQTIGFKGQVTTCPYNPLQSHSAIFKYLRQAQGPNVFNSICHIERSEISPEYTCHSEYNEESVESLQNGLTDFSLRNEMTGRFGQFDL